MRTTSYKGEIVKNYLRKFKSSPTRTIAKKIYDENSAEFSTFDNVRTLVQYYRGVGGSKKKSELKDKSLVIPPFTHKNPWQLPVSYAHPQRKFILPKKDNHILVLGDVHIPYHDKEALSLALDYGKKVGINTIFFNGDLLDFYQISYFDKLDRRRSVKQEIQACKQFLMMINARLTGGGILNSGRKSAMAQLSRAQLIFKNP